MPRTSGNRGGEGRFRVTDNTVVTVGADHQKVMGVTCNKFGTCTVYL
jgi:hypothetical protein